MKHATTFLVNETEQPQVISVALMRAIAEARYGLIVTSQIINKVATTRPRDDRELACSVTQMKVLDEEEKKVCYLKYVIMFFIRSETQICIYLDVCEGDRTQHI